MEIIWISGREVKELVDIQSVNLAVEGAFRQHGFGNVEMPTKLYLYFRKFEGDLRCMPAYLPEIGMAGVKVVNVYPANPSKGFPTVMATFMLIEPETGRPISIMNATYMTDVRTGAAGAIAAKYLARADSKTLGLIGSGRQARTQLLAITDVFELEKVLVASRHISNAEKFKKIFEGPLGIDIEVCKSYREVCRADIISTTTPSKKPVIKGEWIEEGTHINAIGADAPGKQELAPELLNRAKVVVDAYEQAVHSGEINVPISTGEFSEDRIYAELGEIVAGLKKGRENEIEITIFDSTGLAIQDVTVAALVYDLAIERGYGRNVEF